jgi:rhamnosyl/mannosyltransferase
MKILQIGKFYPPYHFGGIETETKMLHERMRERGVDNDFLGFLPLSYKHDIMADDHVYLCRSNIIKFSTQFSISYVHRWLAVKDSYDVILISMPNPFVNLVFNFFPAKKAKIVLWWHSDIIKQKILLWLYKPFLIPFLKRVDAVVAPTNIHIEESDYAKHLKPKKHIVPYLH